MHCAMCKLCAQSFKMLPDRAFTPKMTNNWKQEVTEEEVTLKLPLVCFLHFFNIFLFFSVSPWMKDEVTSHWLHSKTASRACSLTADSKYQWTETGYGARPLCLPTLASMHKDCNYVLYFLKRVLLPSSEMERRTLSILMAQSLFLSATECYKLTPFSWGCWKPFWVMKEITTWNRSIFWKSGHVKKFITILDQTWIFSLGMSEVECFLFKLYMVYREVQVFWKNLLMSGEEAGEQTVFAQTDPDEGKETWDGISERQTERGVTLLCRNTESLPTLALLRKRRM